LWNVFFTIIFLIINITEQFFTYWCVNRKNINNVICETRIETAGLSGNILAFRYTYPPLMRLVHIKLSTIFYLKIQFSSVVVSTEKKGFIMKIEIFPVKNSIIMPNFVVLKRSYRGISIDSAIFVETNETLSAVVSGVDLSYGAINYNTTALDTRYISHITYETGGNNNNNSTKLYRYLY